jgi:hypothetical protein
MSYIKIGVADIRTEPRFESERDSQVIYGEDFMILEEMGQFTRIRTEDGVTGFMKSFLITEGENRKYKLKQFFDAGQIKLPFGSLLSDDDVSVFKIPEEAITDLNDNNFSVTDLAIKFLGVPYLWGGTSDFGFDCSGFVQRLYRFTGKLLPRNSDQQRDFCETVDSFDNALPGDLVFFRGHVGLYLGHGKMIHANGHSASVSIDDLFDGGDYAKELSSIFEKIGRVGNTSKWTLQ